MRWSSLENLFKHRQYRRRQFRLMDAKRCELSIDQTFLPTHCRFSIERVCARQHFECNNLCLANSKLGLIFEVSGGLSHSPIAVFEKFIVGVPRPSR